MAARFCMWFTLASLPPLPRTLEQMSKVTPGQGNANRCMCLRVDVKGRILGVGSSPSDAQANSKAADGGRSSSSGGGGSAAAGWPAPGLQTERSGQLQHATPMVFGWSPAGLAGKGLACCVDVFRMWEKESGEGSMTPLLMTLTDMWARPPSRCLPCFSLLKCPDLWHVRTACMARACLQSSLPPCAWEARPQLTAATHAFVFAQGI